MRRSLEVWKMGTVNYLEALKLQEKLASDRKVLKISDTLLSLQHPPTYTVGKRQTVHNLLIPDSELKAIGAELHYTERGGDITFHGPHQAVLYPIISLRDISLGARKYVEKLELTMIELASMYGVKAQVGRRCETGVWVDDRKIGAIGVRISSGITSHGLAFNTDPDLSYFKHIVPCGIANKDATSLKKEADIDLPAEEVLHACYTKVLPSVEVDNPHLVAWSESVAELLELDPKEFERADFPRIFSGASPLVGAMPYAQNYGGHQFGMWAGQLGDGRAITLGEILNSKSERWELQLKGAGKTPYSLFSDGLAVLRSSIREFLCSEAMHSLGIPTTRALCLVTTGKDVMRDMFYDGNPKDEPGAIVCRVAQSFLRFGSYQLHASRGKTDLEIVSALADYTIRYHFPHLETMSNSDSISFSTGEEDNSAVDLTSNKYAAWAVEVAERTASMIARWQDVGFTHGVMNTDNMSVLGLTIDYGPFGFLDAFDPSFTPNTTDLPGRRYCFANQPDVGLWNIAQFTSALSTAELLNDKEADYAMERYGNKFMDEYQAIMTRKLGLTKYNKQLIGELLKNMATDKVDYTNFFRLLSNIKADPTIPEDQLLIPLKAVLLDIGEERKEAWTSWVKSYIQELSTTGVSDEERKVSMNSVNPKYILRNYLCQTAIDAAEQGDFGEVRQLLKVMQCPYDEQPGMEKYARLPPAWAYRPGVCMLSCSS